MKKPLKILTLLILITLVSNAFAASNPDFTKSDSRIKTLVYNEDEVYSVVARTGFQTQIELAQNEIIETISIGDTIGWQITPASNRIFVKPLHKTGITNLSVITNKRGYQFELVSTDSASRNSSHAYLLKFYYPDKADIENDFSDRTRNQLRPVSKTEIPQFPTDSSALEVKPESLNIYNFKYTLTGPEQAAPQKIYDDGRYTYFEYPKGAETATVSIVNPDGTETQIPANVQETTFVKTISVEKIAGAFKITYNGQKVNVFNEQISSLPPIPKFTSN